ncbi:MAG: UDP-N-acetylmuramoyl-tripeptide--D-alanyl-D-alanine ligase [Candidatus Ratteibacteria bacterium]|nr:UDP-N-acetylmuramoyl-tripeptide--D-alanyl-D-alanine ligase [Candidatus Ratteibacteria bacterium]
MELRVAEILKLTGEGTLCQRSRRFSLETEIKGISTDSRKLKRGELFIALKGWKFDGNEFVSDAFKKGAVGAIVSKSKLYSTLRSSQFLIRVPDTLRILGDIARHYKGKFKIPLVAITGSCGKTTTKEIISAFLSAKFRVLNTEGNYNNLVGLPLTLFNISDEYDVAVVEMGMSQAGEIRRLAEIARPDVAVITNIAKAHLGFFDSLEDIAKAKAEIFETFPHPKISILNRDDKFFPYLTSKTKGEIITFGVNKKSNFRAEGITFDSTGRASFYLNGKMKVRMPLHGKGNIYNVLASFAVASSMGIGIEEAVSILSEIELLSGRTYFYKAGGVSILDDTYNANPSSFLNLLGIIEKIKIEGKKILVFGDMLELGKVAKKEHIKAGKLISDSSFDVLITVGQETEFTVKNVCGNKKAWHFSDKDAAKKKIASLLKKGDLLALKGSRAMEMEKMIPDELKKLMTRKINC